MVVPTRFATVMEGVICMGYLLWERCNIYGEKDERIWYLDDFDHGLMSFSVTGMMAREIMTANGLSNFQVTVVHD